MVRAYCDAARVTLSSTTTPNVTAVTRAMRGDVLVVSEVIHLRAPPDVPRGP